MPLESRSAPQMVIRLDETKLASNSRSFSRQRRELTQGEGRNGGKGVGTKSHLAIRLMISIAVSSMPVSEKVACDHKRGE